MSDTNSKRMKTNEQLDSLEERLHNLEEEDVQGLVVRLVQGKLGLVWVDGSAEGESEDVYA